MHRVFDSIAFRIHLAAYAAVNLLLIAINLLTTPQHLWFIWPLAGWGLGIIAHGAAEYYSAGSRRGPIRIARHRA
jgi:hypothetical protein